MNSGTDVKQGIVVAWGTYCRGEPMVAKTLEEGKVWEAVETQSGWDVDNNCPTVGRCHKVGVTALLLIWRKELDPSE